MDADKQDEVLSSAQVSCANGTERSKQRRVRRRLTPGPEIGALAGPLREREATPDPQYAGPCGIVQSARLKSHARPVWIGRNATRLLSLMFIPAVNSGILTIIRQPTQRSFAEVSCAGVLSAMYQGSLLRICLMPENEIRPIVRVVFAWTVCTRPLKPNRSFNPEAAVHCT